MMECWLMKDPVRLSLFYFVLYTTFASWTALFNVHLEHIGFNGLQIGTLNAVYISSSTFVVPFIGILSDRFGSSRVLLFLSFFAAISVFLMGQTSVYVNLLVLVFLMSFLQQPMGSVMDGMTLGYVKNGDGFAYGNFRLWGSAGYAFGAIMVGLIAVRNTFIIFSLASALFGFLFLLNLATLPPRPLAGRGLVNYQSLGIFFRNRELFILLVLLFFFGVGTAPVQSFINLYFTDLGANNRMVGLAFFVQAMCEIPFFLYGVRMVRRIQPERIILLSMVVTILRMVAYGFIKNPLLALPIGIFHGFTISLFLVGVVEYVQSHTPSHLRTTGQALFWAFHFGAGMIVGNVWVGYLKDQIGMGRTMHVEALCSAIVWFAVYIFFRRLPKAQAGD
jgi:PPP family 3-phenylpropionic acid transporter